MKLSTKGRYGVKAMVDLAINQKDVPVSIKSISQRQSTIQRIAAEILAVQREFMLEGVGKLRPLTMAEVAGKIGVHETTVSRAISNKFIDTPQGLFELKYFFTPGFKTGKDGLEKYFQPMLRGEPGAKRVEVTARGKVVRERTKGKPFAWLGNGQASTGAVQVVHIGERDTMPQDYTA